MVFNGVKEINCKKQYSARSAWNYGDETNTEWYNWYKMVTTKYKEICINHKDATIIFNTNNLFDLILIKSIY